MTTSSTDGVDVAAWGNEGAVLVMGHPALFAGCRTELAAETIAEFHNRDLVEVKRQRDDALGYAREMERQRNAFGEALTRIANGDAPADSAADAMQRLARPGGAA